ncbi:MAG: HAD-IA family hydrolase, partial [Planctomycetes bacterium]|nr:HAD-IA family hydrolase [Planctomycetota bacterium]
MKRAVVFDAGNTLIHLDAERIADDLRDAGHSIEVDRLARGEALARRDVSRFVAEGRSTEGLDVRQFYMRRALFHSGIPIDASIEPVLASLATRLATVEGVDHYWCRVIPGTREALLELRDTGWTLAVVSNSDGHIERRLDAAGLGGLFVTVVDSAIVGVEKPNPRIFTIALEVIGVEPSRAIYVGDIFDVDVRGARAVGMEAILVDPVDAHRDLDVERIGS